VPVPLMVFRTPLSPLWSYEGKGIAHHVLGTGLACSRKVTAKFTPRAFRQLILVAEGLGVASEVDGQIWSLCH